MSVVSSATTMNTVFVGRHFQNLTPAYYTINEAVNYINMKRYAEEAGEFNTYTIKVFDGLYPECVKLPDYVALECEGRVILGGDDNIDNQIILEIGQGCTVRNLCITPYTEDKEIGLFVRDATTISSDNVDPYDLDGLTLILNGVSENSSDDITIVFSGNGLTAEEVCNQINDVAVSAGHAIAYVWGRRVYLYSLASVPNDSLIVRSSGTANSVLGFSTTEDTIKYRKNNATILIQGCSIVGNSYYSQVNNGNSWNVGAMVLSNKGLMDTLIDRVVLDGGNSATETSGIILVAGAPVLFGVSISSFGHNGNALHYYDDNFTVIPALINVASYLNSYDLKLGGTNDKEAVLMSTVIDIDNINPASTATFIPDIKTRPYGLGYGGLYSFENTSSINIIGVGLPNKVGLGNCFTNEMVCRYGVTPDVNSGTVSIGKAGTYLVEAEVSVRNDSTSDAEIGIGIFNSNGSNMYASMVSKILAGDIQSYSMSNIISLSSNDSIMLYAWSSVAPVTIVLEQCYLKVIEFR